MQAPAFVHRESYMHQMAKDLLAQWLADATEDGDRWQYPLVGGDLLAWRPNGTPAFVEYPFTQSGRGQSPPWDEVEQLWDFDESTGMTTPLPPTFENVVAAGFKPWAVADIAIRHKGTVNAVIEVVHKHPLTAEKVGFYKSIGVWQIFAVQADWVLKQIGKPDQLLLKVF